MTPEELESELTLACAADGLGAGSPNGTASSALVNTVGGVTANQTPLAGYGPDFDSRWRLMLRGSRETLILLSAEGSIVFSMAPAGGRAAVAQDAIGAAFADKAHPEDAEVVRAALAGVILSPGDPVSFVARFGGDDEWRWYDFVASNLLEEPLVAAIVVNGRDVTESKRLEERLDERAERDGLTGLLNREAFLDCLELALARSPVASHTGVFFVDIIDFRGFVDRHGPAVGEQLLGAVAERLRTDVYDGATAARLGGDEFALLCEGVEGATGAAEIAKRITSVVGAPIRVGADEVKSGVTVGVALGTSGMLQPATLLRHAEVAMYRARQGQGHYDIYRRHRQPRSSPDLSTS
jgi:diguanylate cyclase (GGDEF)-like protein